MLIEAGYSLINSHCFSSSQPVFAKPSSTYSGVVEGTATQFAESVAIPLAILFTIPKYMLPRPCSINGVRVRYT